MSDNAPGSQPQAALPPASPPASALPRTAPLRLDALLVPLLIFAAIAGLFSFALMRPGDPTKIPSALIGRPAPQIELAPLEGLVEGGTKPRQAKATSTRLSRHSAALASVEMP